MSRLNYVNDECDVLVCCSSDNILKMGQLKRNMRAAYAQAKAQSHQILKGTVSQDPQLVAYTCADLESIVIGGQTLTTFFFVF